MTRLMTVEKRERVVVEDHHLYFMRCDGCDLEVEEFTPAKWSTLTLGLGLPSSKSTLDYCPVCTLLVMKFRRITSPEGE